MWAVEMENTWDVIVMHFLLVQIGIEKDQKKKKKKCQICVHSTQRKKLFLFRSFNLISICSQKGYESLVADNLRLPFRDSCFVCKGTIDLTNEREHSSSSFLFVD
jgi:hypothetical protein